jgi:hypothetical protein
VRNLKVRRSLSPTSKYHISAALKLLRVDTKNELTRTLPHFSLRTHCTQRQSQTRHLFIRRRHLLQVILPFKTSLEGTSPAATTLQLTLANPVTVNPDLKMNEKKHNLIRIEKWGEKLFTAEYILSRHMAFRKEDESLVCSDKKLQFLQSCIITFKNKYKINALSFYSF